MAITTSLKRSCLDDAWEAAQVKSSSTPDLRAELRLNEKTARRTIAGGSFASIEANGRKSGFSLYGPGQVTPAEIVEAWRALIDLYDKGNSWLTLCAKYGLDPAQAELDDLPDPLPAALAHPAAVGDSGVYSWMMNHLIPIREARSDYTFLRMPAGAVWT